VPAQEPVERPAPEPGRQQPLLAHGRRRSRGGRGRRGMGRNSAFGNHPKDGANLDRCAFGNHNFCQCACGLGVNLKCHFIGFKLNQRLIDRDTVTGLLHPLGNGRFRHRFTKGRDLDFGCHFCSRLSLVD
jgi:hypothetical protein